MIVNSTKHRSAQPNHSSYPTRRITNHVDIHIHSNHEHLGYLLHFRILFCLGSCECRLAHPQSPNSISGDNSMFNASSLKPHHLTGYYLKQSLLKLVHPLFASINVEHRSTAHLICTLIPTQCPFEREICFLGHKLFHLPPLCKLNPTYEEMVALRFRALSYLADQCGEDVSQYCS